MDELVVQISEKMQPPPTYQKKKREALYTHPPIHPWACNLVLSCYSVIALKPKVIKSMTIYSHSDCIQQPIAVTQQCDQYGVMAIIYGCSGTEL